MIEDRTEGDVVRVRGGALSGEMGRTEVLRMCVGSGLSAWSVIGAGAGIEVDGGFGFEPARMGRSERAGVGMVVGVVTVGRIRARPSALSLSLSLSLLATAGGDEVESGGGR